MENLKKEIIKFVKTHPGTSYVELERLFDDLKFDWKGDLAICESNNEMLIFWINWNRQAIEVIKELEKEKRIIRKPCSALIYAIDGRLLNFPIAKQSVKYKHPHWLPMQFSVVRGGK